MSDPNQQPLQAPRTLRRGVPRGNSNPLPRLGRNPIRRNVIRQRRNFPIRRPRNFQNIPLRKSDNGEPGNGKTVDGNSHAKK